MKELSLQNCRLDGRYDIQEFLGRGSYAEIYIARDILASPQSAHHRIVIKALNVFLQDDLDADLERTLVENFQNEAIALDRVRHPNIISRLGHGTARDLDGTVFHYLVLEYLPGGDLAKLRQKQPLSLPHAINYLEQICAGLAHAHKHGVIHRDIKPQNLLLSGNLEIVKIADFGVAKLSQNDTPITRVGTQMYAPPEHNPLFFDVASSITVTELTPAADVYSLAKSAYVLLTGQSPRRFTGCPISDLPADFADRSWSLDLLRVLRKATLNNPLDRYQTVTQFWQDLAGIQFTPEPADETEQETSVAAHRHRLPQAYISKDFSPRTPLLPKFNTSSDLSVSAHLPEERDARIVVKIGDKPQIAKNGQAMPPVVLANPNFSTVRVPKTRSSFIRRALVLAFLFTTLGFALFATQNYLRNGKLFPKMSGLFAKSEGVANSDVNIRAASDVDSQKVGLAPKGSRVRIVNIKDNWMEVDIIEFGRPKDNPGDAEHGWVNRRYIDQQE